MDGDQPSLDLNKERDNLLWNKLTWGKAAQWENEYAYGYRWPGGVHQNNSSITLISEKYLLPHLGKRRDLKILELAPGAGRFTPELLRLSREIHLLDVNEACIEICRERFKYYPNVKYYVNDGRSCEAIPDNDFDLIASWDSMVHMAVPIIENYVCQFAKKLCRSGIMWLDHCGRGTKEVGSRTAMTKHKMETLAEALSLLVVAQYYRNDHDCISVFQKR